MSPQGSDSANAPGTISAPWKTLKYALEQLRALRPKTPGPGDAATITLRGGVYHLASPLELGRSDQYLTLQNHKNEHVSLSGGIPLDLSWVKTGQILSGRFTWIYFHPESSNLYKQKWWILDISGKL